MRISIYLSGFPPIPGQKATGAEQGFVAALVAADKLTSTETVEIADEEDDDEVEVSLHPCVMYLLLSFSPNIVDTVFCVTGSLRLLVQKSQESPR